jgi:hypothetical protein
MVDKTTSYMYNNYIDNTLGVNMFRILKSFLIGFIAVFTAKTVYYKLRDRNK